MERKNSSLTATSKGLASSAKEGSHQLQRLAIPPKHAPPPNHGMKARGEGMGKELIIGHEDSLTMNGSLEVLKVHLCDLVKTTFENGIFELTLKNRDEKLATPLKGNFLAKDVYALESLVELRNFDDQSLEQKSTKIKELDDGFVEGMMAFIEELMKEELKFKDGRLRRCRQTSQVAYDS
ncbi:hypothetical protein M9H77_30251 [Catharanthus roseus]|uniref:Uncharacterized protein n=1 Tax=Catharanthus roseus TaxID=4058 RepID=A0ACB9ZX28_CATRO|nr:hypothetical protein M9H77_30251 [Catharanthus roseus]